MRIHTGGQAEARTPPLRFAVMGRGTVFPAWQAQCIRDLRASGVAELVLLTVERSNGLDAAAPRPRRWLWPLLRRCLFRSCALVPVDLREELTGVALLAGTDALPILDSFNLDFVLNFNGRVADGAMSAAARHGVWSYDQAGQGESCGFWDTYDGLPVTTASLQRETAEGFVVLQHGRFKAQPHALGRTQNGVLLGGTEWPRQVCTDIQNGHLDALSAEPVLRRAAPRGEPNVLQALYFVAKQAASRITRILRVLFCHPLWTIGIVSQHIEAFLDSNYRPTIRWLPEPPDGTFIADPFAVSHANKLTILYEDFYFHDNRGRIACVEVADGRPLSPAQTVFDLPFHMSYPYLFEHEGTIYCIPETHEAGEAVLYEAVEFPTRWRRAATLLEGFPACDSTVFQHEGRWWLACTSYRADSSLKLYLWYAPALRGPWQPHANNPVKTDIASSRPAGTPFVRGGVLYRPAQDCSVRYGGRVVNNRVLRLTPTEFQEEIASVVEPDRAGPYASGLHTISVCGNVTVVDGLRYRFSPRAFLANVRRFLRLGLRLLIPARKSRSDVEKLKATVGAPAPSHAS